MNRALDRIGGRVEQREGRRVDPLGVAALAGLAGVFLAFGWEIHGLSLAAGTVAEVFLDPTRLAGATLWVAGWVWGLV